MNSRHQRKLNQIWRRRKCTNCGAVLTSHEAYEFAGSLRYKSPDGKLIPFKKEKLFLSVLKTCEHRKSALDDAIELTQTIMGKLIKVSDSGVITAQSVSNITFSVLKNFDHAASVQYAAYHPDFSYD
jgi:transcriptional regulator NrdR family protein